MSLDAHHPACLGGKRGHGAGAGHRGKPLPTVRPGPNASKLSLKGSSSEAWEKAYKGSKEISGISNAPKESPSDEKGKGS